MLTRWLKSTNNSGCLAFGPHCFYNIQTTLSSEFLSKGWRQTLDPISFYHDTRIMFMCVYTCTQHAKQNWSNDKLWNKYYKRQAVVLKENLNILLKMKTYVGSRYLRQRMATPERVVGQTWEERRKKSRTASPFSLDQFLWKTLKYPFPFFKVYKSLQKLDRSFVSFIPWVTSSETGSHDFEMQIYRSLSSEFPVPGEEKSRTEVRPLLQALKLCHKDTEVCFSFS